MPDARPAGGTYYYLSNLLGARVFVEGEGPALGRLRDIGFAGGAAYPPAVSLEVAVRKNGVRVLPWSAVVEFSAKGIRTRRTDEPAPPADFWVRRDVLDDQVVDLSGAKVRRVNDVQFLYAEGQLVPAHVEIGVYGLLRRLGVARAVAGLLRWLFDYTLKERFITWRHVQVVSPGGSPGGVRVTALASRLADLHPAELADILEELGAKERQALLRTLDPETAAGALEEVTPDVQRTMLAQEEPGKAADILEEMPAQEAADLLRELPDPEAQRIISRMDFEAAEDVRELLAHEDESAGSMMSTSCIEAAPDDIVADVLEAIRRRAEEIGVFNIIYVLDEGRRLVGVVSLRELFAASPDARIGRLMTTHLIKVGPEARLRDLARLFAKYGLRAVPVVDERGGFLGAVRLKDVLNELAPLIREER
ncbi:MAG TPA: CBS domain-containing protein [Planctomycetota bacterium]|nr:CBS domain-containing protein [Planctomycetota bacterium]HRR79277.1 CBS domain-containing protein [Planctomycetota bacterium]